MRTCKHCKRMKGDVERPPAKAAGPRDSLTRRTPAVTITLRLVQT